MYKVARTLYLDSHGSTAQFIFCMQMSEISNVAFNVISVPGIPIPDHQVNLIFSRRLPPLFISRKWRYSRVPPFFRVSRARTQRTVIAKSVFSALLIRNIFFSSNKILCQVRIDKIGERWKFSVFMFRFALPPSKSRHLVKWDEATREGKNEKPRLLGASFIVYGVWPKCRLTIRFCIISPATMHTYYVIMKTDGQWNSVRLAKCGATPEYTCSISKRERRIPEKSKKSAHKLQ